MQVGSIVVVLPFEVDEEYKSDVKWLPVMDEKTPYMIRTMERVITGNIGVSFEEGVIGVNNYGNEYLVHIKYVREVLPPEDISLEIEEMMTEPEIA